MSFSSLPPTQHQGSGHPSLATGAGKPPRKGAVAQPGERPWAGMGPRPGEICDAHRAQGFPSSSSSGSTVANKMPRGNLIGKRRAPLGCVSVFQKCFLITEKGDKAPNQAESYQSSLDS